MLKLQRGRYNVDFGKFYLNSNELTIETFSSGKLDISHLFHLNGEMVNIVITNNNGLSSNMSSNSVTTVSPSSNVKWTTFTLNGDLTFYRNGVQIASDILPYDTDLWLTFDKSVEPPNISISNPQHGDVLSYDGVLGKFINSTSSSSGSSNMSYKFIGGFPIVEPPTPNNGDWFIDISSHNLLFSVIDTNDNDHSDIFSKIGFNSIIRVNMNNGNNRYYCVTQSTPNDNWYIFKYDSSLSSTIEGTLTEDTVYDVSFFYQTVRNLDDLSDVYIDNPSENQLLQYDLLLGWTNKTVSNGGGIVPMAGITWTGSENRVISQYNIGDGTVLSLTSPTFTNNNSSLPINPTWSQHGTYPCLLVFNPSNAVTLKLDWHIKFSSIPNNSFEIGYAWRDGYFTKMDSIVSGQMSYSGSVILVGDGTYGPNLNLFLSMRCTNALNQTVTITMLNFTVVGDRVIS